MVNRAGDDHADNTSAAKLDNLDRRLLNYLITDSRSSARKLAMILGVSTITVLSRIKKMEKAGIIRGYTARLNHDMLGYTITAVIEVVAKKNKIVDIEERLAKRENVCAVYDVTGGSDIVVVVKFKGRREMSEFVKKLGAIPNVENTVTRLVLNTVKEDFRLT